MYPETIEIYGTRCTVEPTFDSDGVIIHILLLDPAGEYYTEFDWEGDIDEAQIRENVELFVWNRNELRNR